MENLKDILHKAALQFDRLLPFVLYATPGENNLSGLFQNDTNLYLSKDFLESGFVFAPFEGKDYLLIPKEHSQTVSTDFLPSANSLEESKQHPTDAGWSHYEILVQKGVDAIRNGEFNKVVLSRKEIVALPGYDFTVLFEKLLHAYPSAFRYCWFHPQVGFWMGATPEKLLSSSKGKLQTMALAGTQKFNESKIVEWGEKEVAEQEFVTNFIRDGLKDLVSNMTISKPYTAKAGNLLHIKTDIEGTLNSDSSVKAIVERLHPTPAVCGLPKGPARSFILENEDYDREYYSGFLGALNTDSQGGQSTELYVNLRCMQLKANAVHLYMGCGITKNSHPEKEYIETVNKSMTIKKIL